MSKWHLFIALAIGIAFGGAAFWFWNSKPDGEALDTSGAFSERPRADHPADTRSIVAKNTPVVTGFTGDLLAKGNTLNGGGVEPFVVGDSLTLEALALNAVE